MYYYILLDKKTIKKCQIQGQCQINGWGPLHMATHFQSNYNGHIRGKSV